jgi:hypothetical protein
MKIKIASWGEVGCYAMLLRGKFVTAGRKSYLRRLDESAQLQDGAGVRTRAAIECAVSGSPYDPAKAAAQ